MARSSSSDFLFSFHFSLLFLCSGLFHLAIPREGFHLGYQTDLFSCRQWLIYFLFRGTREPNAELISETPLKTVNPLLKTFFAFLLEIYDSYTKLQSRSFSYLISVERSQQFSTFSKPLRHLLSRTYTVQRQ